MYRVVVVDDEEPVLESFRYIFGKFIEDFSIVGFARNGREAVQEIVKLNPDLVFMDIQMPGISGIDVIKQLRPFQTDTVFILSTAYERFDIAKKAINLGVFSYLVKPVSKTKVLEEVDKVKEYLDSSNRDKTNLIDEVEYHENHIRDIKKKFLTELTWRSPELDVWRGIIDITGFNSDRGKVVILGVDPVMEQSDRELLYRTICTKIDYKIRNISTQLGEKLILLIPDSSFTGRISEYLERIIRENTGYDVTIGFGELYNFDQLNNSYREALGVFRNTEVELNLYHIVDNLLESRETIGQTFEEIYMTLSEKSSFDIFRSKLSSLFILLMRGIDIHDLTEAGIDSDITTIIFSFSHSDDLKLWCLGVVKNLSELIFNSVRDKYPVNLLRAMDYIAENYNKPLQLSQVADACKLSTSYLSRLFSEHLNKKFIDYVNLYKIERAINFLREENLSIKEAAFRVGYSDANYFSRIFKKYKGVNPSSFEGKV